MFYSPGGTIALISLLHVVAVTAPPRDAFAQESPTGEADGPAIRALWLTLDASWNARDETGGDQ